MLNSIVECYKRISSEDVNPILSLHQYYLFHLSSEAKFKSKNVFSFWKGFCDSSVKWY